MTTARMLEIKLNDEDRWAMMLEDGITAWLKATDDLEVSESGRYMMLSLLWKAVGLAGLPHKDDPSDKAKIESKMKEIVDAAQEKFSTRVAAELRSILATASTEPATNP